MTQAVDIKRLWWAVQGTNLWPLPCQVTSLAVLLAFWAIIGDFEHVSFITSSYAPWATVGQISNPVAKASKVEPSMAGSQGAVRRNNRWAGLRVGGMARSMQGGRHLLSGVTGRRDAHLSLRGVQ